MTRIKVNSLFFSECIPEWSWDTRRNILQDYDLWYVSRGEGVLRASNRVFRLGRGSCFVLRPGEGYLATHDPENPLSVYAVHFDYSSPDQLLPFTHTIEDTLFFETLCKRLIESDEENREAWMQAVLHEYIDTYKQKTSYLSLNQKRTRQLQEYIKNHLESALPLNALADIIYLSTNQTTRVFKQVTGETIQDYILKERISQARTLLRQSTLPIKRIAQLCGYNDPGFFCRHFKRISGTTPNGFRYGQRVTQGVTQSTARKKELE
ncbi:MAG: helix-turn-helix transcriptional regulator [Bacteroidetes bacterium]|nr:helix-turn-helix transcriptional regulator [Bacteroidota bacterium]